MITRRSLTLGPALLAVAAGSAQAALLSMVDPGPTREGRRCRVSVSGIPGIPTPLAVVVRAEGVVQGDYISMVRDQGYPEGYSRVVQEVDSSGAVSMVFRGKIRSLRDSADYTVFLRDKDGQLLALVRCSEDGVEI